MRYFILGLFAALLIVAPAASAKAVKVKPVYSVTAATKSGKNVKFTIAVTVAQVPKCTGKVTATHKLSKKKSVSWSARYTGDSAICTAAIHGKLPAANYRKKTKFAIKFPGNDSIKKFSVTKSLTLTPPPAPPTPAPSPPTGNPTPIVYGPQKPGPWFMSDVDPSGEDGFTFNLQSDRKVPAFQHLSGMTMNCGSGHEATQVPFQWNNTFFDMGGQFGTVSSSGDRQYVTNMSYTVNFNFADAHSGTGHFAAVGNFQPDPGNAATLSCTESFDVTLSGGNP
jgi:hypothetical protein